MHRSMELPWGKKAHSRAELGADAGQSPVCDPIQCADGVPSVPSSACIAASYRVPNCTNDLYLDIPRSLRSGFAGGPLPFAICPPPVSPQHSLLVCPGDPVVPSLGGKRESGKSEKSEKSVSLCARPIQILSLAAASCVWRVCAADSGDPGLAPLIGHVWGCSFLLLAPSCLGQDSPWLQTAIPINLPLQREKRKELLPKRLQNRQKRTGPGWTGPALP